MLFPMTTSATQLVLRRLETDQTARDMQQIIRDHDAALANWRQQKQLHPDLDIIDDMIRLIEKHRALAVDLLNAPSTILKRLANNPQPANR